ncbi:hypothetical protein EDC01DRAFT_731450 [Geopyxis carbonaria]|nr:hypothetical protein EDC01DRAFT_731450 [Geopyxis carbonaria]
MSAPPPSAPPLTATGPPSSWPAFTALPLTPSGPPGNAWGLYPNRDLGSLNLLTPSNTASAASSEIHTGQRVSLDWPLGHPRNPSFNRAPFKHTILPHKRLAAVNDDSLVFNTQCGSQWDGFRHYGYLEAERWYGGVRRGELANDGGPLGIDAWAAAGGIVGRGVLLDHARWVKDVLQQPPRAVFESTQIPLSELLATAAHQGVDFRTGDILFTRTGFTAAYEALSPEQEAAVCKRPEPEFIGLRADREMVEWLWERHFAAVAGDQPSFEAAPIETLTDRAYMLHHWLLAGWGTPVGEMFDLEEVARTCERLGRWSFFVVSVPLKVPGGVASPPNAVAIF